MTFSNIKTQTDTHNLLVFRKKLAGLSLLLVFMVGINFFIYSEKYDSATPPSIVNTNTAESNFEEQPTTESASIAQKLEKLPL